MSNYDYDLFTIGAGSGGVRASRFAGSFGAKVAIAEEKHMGGTCVNVGCVPKKLFVYAAEFAEAFVDSRGFGWSVENPNFDWSTLLNNKNTEIERLNGIYDRLLGNANVDVLRGRARLIDAHTVEVDGKTVTAENILIATGGQPRRFDFPGSEHTITSDEVFFIEEFPENILIVGGGYIGVEFAGIFHNLGANVTLVELAPAILNGFDQDIQQALCDEYVKKGIDVRTEIALSEVAKREDGRLDATLTNGDTLVVDTVMMSVGRVPNTAGIGLEEAGVKLTPRGHVEVDEYMRTSVPNIYALGDVMSVVPLTPVATEQGMILARNLFSGGDFKMDYDNIPTAVFSQPNAGTVGLTEAAARERYEQVDIYRASFRPMKHTISGRDERTMMKLVVDGESDRVLGVHMVGPYAGEIIQGFGVALKAGATKAVFDATVGIHPTSAEEFVTMRNKVA